MFIQRILLFGLCLWSFAVVTYSQSPSPTPKPSLSPPSVINCDACIRAYEQGQREREALSPKEMMAGRYAGRTRAETQLGWAILIFGLLIIGLEVIVMLKLQKGWGIQSIRVVGLTLVLTSGLFLIVTGYSQEQIAPMIGLLGTITGFLLGKTSSTKEPE